MLAVSPEFNCPSFDCCTLFVIAYAQNFCTPPSDKMVLLAKKTYLNKKPSTHLHIYSIANSHSPHQSCWQKDPPMFQVIATELTVFTLWYLFKVTAWVRYLISLTLLILASTPECSYTVNFVENKHEFTKAAKKYIMHREIRCNSKRLRVCGSA